MSKHKRLETLWRKLCEKAGLDLKPVPIKGFHPVGKKGGGVRLESGSVRYNTRIHGLRKFFKTSCSVNGVDRMAPEAFLDHSLTKFGVESLYDFCVSKAEWLRDEYQKVLRSVTFLKPIPVLDVENHEARNRVRQLQGELEEERRNKEDLENRIKRTERKLVELTKLVKELLDRPEIT